VPPALLGFATRMAALARMISGRCHCEFTHECLAIRVARKLKAIDVIDVLSDLFILRGIPAHIRSSSPRRCRNGSLLSVPRPPISSGVAHGITATLRASTPAFAMSCSTAKFSTLCARPRSSSRAGDATTTRSGHTPQSDTSRQHQRCSCPHSPRGRLRYDQRRTCRRFGALPMHRELSKKSILE